MAKWIARNKKPAAIIAVTPPQRPSRPSIRFVALQHPTITKITSIALLNTIAYSVIA